MNKKWKILVADDNNLNREFFSIMLGKLGFVVDVAEDGKTALELIRKHSPDIIILDDMLPEITGWQVTKMLKQDSSYSQFSNIPVIMLSEMADPEAIVEGFELGVEDYIRKPFSFAVVYARIKAAIKNREVCRKIADVKMLTETVNFLSRHLPDSIKELEDLIAGECAESEKLKTLLKERTEKISAVLKSLSDAVDEFKEGEGENLSFYVANLEERYRNYLQVKDNESI